MAETVTLPNLNPMRTAPRDGSDYLGMDWEGTLVRLRWSDMRGWIVAVGRAGATMPVMDMNSFRGWWPLPEVNDA